MLPPARLQHVHALGELGGLDRDLAEIVLLRARNPRGQHDPEANEQAGVPHVATIRRHRPTQRRFWRHPLERTAPPDTRCGAGEPAHRSRQGRARTGESPGFAANPAALR